MTISLQYGILGRHITYGELSHQDVQSTVYVERYQWSEVIAENRDCLLAMDTFQTLFMAFLFSQRQGKGPGEKEKRQRVNSFQRSIWR